MQPETRRGPAARMRPILLKGHERPLTFLKYNAEGDLLVTCAKDHTPNLCALGLRAAAAGDEPAGGERARGAAAAWRGSCC